MFNFVSLNSSSRPSVDVCLPSCYSILIIKMHDVNGRNEHFSSLLGGARASRYR